MMNAGAKIINVQWDFDYGERFSSTPGYSFVRGEQEGTGVAGAIRVPSGGQEAHRLQGAGRHGRRGALGHRDRGELTHVQPIRAIRERLPRLAAVDGMPGLKADSYKYIEFLTSKDDDQERASRKLINGSARPETLWPHSVGIVPAGGRARFSAKAEIGADGLLLNIVTGGGKTGADRGGDCVVAHCAQRQKFAMLYPNLIVRDRLEDDFEAGKVFMTAICCRTGGIAGHRISYRRR